MAVIADVTDISSTDSSTAGALRFVQRGDKRILQQQWRVIKYHHSGRLSDGWYEWRDVPLVDENTGFPPEGPSQAKR